MNISGSDVSKEAANMILLGTFYALTEIVESQLTFALVIDDNFASTVSEWTPDSSLQIKMLSVVAQRELPKADRSSLTSSDLFNTPFPTVRQKLSHSCFVSKTPVLFLKFADRKLFRCCRPYSSAAVRHSDPRHRCVFT